MNRRRHTPGKPGRPCKFSTAVLVALTAALLAGEPFEAAARAAGIGASTLYRWQAKARAGDARFGPLAALVREARRTGCERAALANLSLTIFQHGF
jgi:hypothetical protein